MATAADYDSDRETEQKRVQQMLQDLDDSFSEQEGKFVVEPAYCEQDIVVTTSVWYICVVLVCMHPSGFVRAITNTFKHGFQSNLAQLLFLMSRSTI